MVPYVAKLKSFHCSILGELHFDCGVQPSSPKTAIAHAKARFLQEWIVPKLTSTGDSQRVVAGKGVGAALGKQHSCYKGASS